MWGPLEDDFANVDSRKLFTDIRSRFNPGSIVDWSFLFCSTMFGAANRQTAGGDLT